MPIKSSNHGGPCVYTTPGEVLSRDTINELFIVAWRATLSSDIEGRFTIIRGPKQTFAEGCEQTVDKIEGAMVIGHFDIVSPLRTSLDKTVEKRWETKVYSGGEGEKRYIFQVCQ